MADAPKITPITIKPITIKPAAPAAAAPAAPAAAPAAPAPAPAAPAAPGGTAIRPIVISPRPAGANPLANANPGATIRLTPVAADGSLSAAKPAAKPAADDTAPTIAIKPIAIKPKVVATPAPTPKPAAPTAQAMKGTTSRISLDSALAQPAAGGAPAAMGKITSNLTKAATDAAKPAPDKAPAGDDAAPTIRLKKPIAPAVPAAPAPAAGPKPLVKPAAPAAAPETPAADPSEAPTIRKKSLVLKKPAGPAAGTPAPKPALTLKPDAAPADEPKAGGSIAVGTGPGGGLDDFEAPPSALSQGGMLPGGSVRVKKTHWVFPVVGFLDVAALVAVIVVFMAQTCGQDRTLTDYTTYNKDGSPIVLGGSVQFRGR